MRASTVSHFHPIVRRTDQAVLAWVFRLTLEEAGVSAYENITVAVPEDQQRSFARWTQSGVLAFCDVAVAVASEPRILALHDVLDQRMAAEERPDLDIGGLPI